jgi:hypothetical protein
VVALPKQGHRASNLGRYSSLIWPHPNPTARRTVRAGVHFSFWRATSPICRKVAGSCSIFIDMGEYIHRTTEATEGKLPGGWEGVE